MNCDAEFVHTNIASYILGRISWEWTAQQGPPATEQYSFLPSLVAKSSGPPPQFEAFSPVIWKIAPENF
jgi:hypothetical protein